MDETHIRSADLDGDRQGSRGSLQSLHKVFRQGEKVFQVLDENVTMVGDRAFPATTTMEQPEEKLDEVASGESLFKTFAFDNAISQEETEKCLSFWRSVVEKNLEPIKCSLIDNVTNFPRVEEKPGKQPSKQLVVEKPSKLKPQKNIWYDVLLELQEKRYQETKLLLKKRCRFCGYTKKPGYQADDPAADTKKTLAELSTWEPKSHRRLSGTHKVPQQIKAEPAKPRNSSSQSEDKAEEAKPRDDQAAMLKEIKEKSQKIHYVDAIKHKREEGSYGKWHRDNMAACKCIRTNCDCISNPASRTVVMGSSSSNEPQSAQPPSEASFEQDERSINSQPIHVVTGDLQLVKNENRESLSSSEVSSVNKSEAEQEGRLTELYKDSDMLRMSYASCKIAAQKSSQDEEELSEGTSILGTSETLEIISDSSSADDEKSLPEEPATEKLYQPAKPRKSILKSKDEVEISKRRMKTSLSVVIACTCSNPTCDCSPIHVPQEKPSQEATSLELIKRKITDIESDRMEDERPADRPEHAGPSSLASKSVDSLELMKHRLSCTWEGKEEAQKPKSRTVSIME